MTPAKFITFEGGEGSGKSTQAARLAARLIEAGVDVVRTREPGGSAFAEKLRGVLLDPDTPPHDALAEALVFYAARADHLARTIRPALYAGQWVICDRFADSTRVYQCSAGGLATDICDRLDAMVVGQTQPDLTFVLDIPASIGLARAEQRRAERNRARMKDASGYDDQENGDSNADAQYRTVRGGTLADRYEARDMAFHDTLRRGFLDIVLADAGRCRLIDGEQEADVIADEIWSMLAAELGVAA